jgi:hypothetical protein
MPGPCARGFALSMLGPYATTTAGTAADILTPNERIHATSTYVDALTSGISKCRFNQSRYHELEVPKRIRSQNPIT